MRRPENEHQGTTLLLGGTGKTGRRIAERLVARGRRVRIGSRSAQPPFDWEDQATWAPALRNVSAAYVNYYPDLAVPGAADAIRSFVELALEHGVRRLVLLSGRGEEEAERAERILQRSGADWTILRATWFAQNFSESFLRDQVVAGEVALPAGNVPAAFLDADDIADVAAAVLTEDGHVGQLYELTGPRLLTFAEAVKEVATAIGREIRYVQLSPQEYAAALTSQSVPPDFVWLLNYLFGTVLIDSNATLADGVRSVLGRAPRDFAAYVRDAAAAGAWDAATVAGHVDFGSPGST